ncbi:MAG: hypothetical protein H0T69_05100 [Thermoleophilaceae bacterium]|nr:hypothetical protein [Thermoleophilaceae bacterium]
MAADIDTVYKALETLDDEQLENEITELREQQDEVARKLGRRLDLLELKRRWRNHQAHGRPLGTERDIHERLARQASPDAAEDAPRGTEAARRVMRDGGVWTVKRLHSELVQRGWVNPEAQHPEKATETALSRLHKKYHEVDRVGRGQYRYKTAPHDPNLLDPSGSAEP